MALPEEPLRPGTVIRMRKPHPCGGKEWVVLRTGQKVELRCCTCGRVVALDIMTLRKRGTGIVDHESGSTHSR